MAYGFKIFLELQYKRPHRNPHVSSALGNQYNFRIGLRLGEGKFAIHHILSAYFACKNHPEKIWSTCNTDKQN